MTNPPIGIASEATKGSVVPVTGRRNMIMYALDKNEITLLSLINQGAQLCFGLGAFFIGSAVTLGLSRAAIPPEDYELTSLKLVFPWLMTGFIVSGLVFSVGAAFLSWKTKPTALKIISDETVHGE